MYVTCFCAYNPIRKILRPYFTDKEIEAQRGSAWTRLTQRVHGRKKGWEDLGAEGAITLRIEPDLGGEPPSHLQARIRVQSARMHILASSLRAC